MADEDYGDYEEYETHDTQGDPPPEGDAPPPEEGYEDEYAEYDEFDEILNRGEQGDGGRSIWVWIAGGVGGLIVLGLICVGVLAFTGIGFGGGTETAAQAATSTPIVTLVPTADVNLANASPTPDPNATPTPTATPQPPEGQITNPAEGDRYNINDSIAINAAVQSDLGVANLQILDNEQVLFSQSYSGNTELSYGQNWVPLADGPHQLKLVITDRANQRHTLDSVSVRIVDQDFISRNEATFNRVQADVAQIRGLRLTEGVLPFVMGQGELKQYMRSRSYTPDSAYEDMLLLSMFDFVERGYDLYEASIQYAGSGIAGFYDPETKDFVIVSSDKNISTLEEFIYAHELMHALQDQSFGLSDLTAADPGLTFEGSLPLRALAEGEARLLEELYIESISLDDITRAEIFNDLQLAYRPQQTTINPPPVLSEAFLFPYEGGLAFVRSLYENGGWAAVNNAWQNVPASTEQILHPDRYQSGDLPQTVTIAPGTEVLGEGWVAIHTGTLGEFYLRQWLVRHLSPDDVDIVATGWGGDAYTVYYNETADQVALVWQLAWDTAADAAEFRQTYPVYADSAYGTIVNPLENGAQCRPSLDLVCYYEQGDQFIIVRAPDQTTALQLLNQQIGTTGE